MLFINNNSDSKISKLIAVVFAISAIIGLAVQVMSILSMTRTKIGKKIRHNVIGTMYDVVDESIDEAAIRAPQWMEKAKKLG